MYIYITKKKKKGTESLKWKNELLSLCISLFNLKVFTQILYSGSFSSQRALKTEWFHRRNVIYFHVANYASIVLLRTYRKRVPF